MKIDSSITGINPVLPGIKPLASAAGAAIPGQPSFGDLLQQQLGEVQRLNDEASVMQQRLLSGEAVSLEAVTASVNKADMALTFALQLRNKILDAYQEINRMQV